MPQTSTDLERLAQTDTVAAPLASLQAVAIESADWPGWDWGVPPLGSSDSGDGAPLLHGLTLVVDADRQRALLVRLADTLARSGSADAAPLGALVRSETFDPLGLLAASLCHDAAALEAVAVQANVDGAALAVIAHTASLPLLLACGRRAARAVESLGWSRGSCPVCAAWPTLAEMRGLARDVFLRCGRCASGWRDHQRGCAFCGNRDHQTLAYFAGEQERESRRAEVCDGCHGYLKTMATLGPLSPADLLLRDLQSLELDVSALDHGYAQPDGLGWRLSVRVEAARSDELQQREAREADRGRSWRRWW
jgi:FdhE protein